MSLEKRREPNGVKEEERLKESKFRRLDFTPLDSKKELIEEGIKEAPIIEELTEIEKNILIIAEDILKLKRYDAEFEIETQAQIQKFPIIEKLYAKCIAKLSFKKGYSKEEIFLAIRSLEEKNWIVTNERRTKLEVLNNKKLMRILKFIESNPGIHARDDKVTKDLKITRTPFLKHVMTLERFKLIRSKRIGKMLHYFPVDLPEDYDKYKKVFLNPIVPQIIEEFFKDEGISISTMGDKLDIYSGTIQYHINKLKKLNLIRSAKNQVDNKIHLVNIEILKKYNDFFKEPDFTKLLKGL
jgi:predicted transcriptional regulator